MEPLSGIELAVANIIGSIAVLFGWAMTQILVFMAEMLVAVAGYNEFATADAVDRGWVIVRDLTNMFFILVMLIIAFGTILGVEEYSYKRMLPRLLIMAVVINFSKVICGLLIDFSQVVMLTFVNGFSAIAGGNFVRMFQVSGAWNLLSNNAAEAAEASFTWSTVGSLVLGGVLMMVAAVAVFIMTLMLVGRIVMLWLLIVMSPLAFFLSAFPKGRAAEMYGKWWGMFGNYVIIGPFIAFFLWLSLAVAGSGDIANSMQIVREGAGGAGTSLFVSELGGQQQFYSFIIAIALLMGGMSMSAQFGVMGGSMMSGAASYIQNKGIGAVKGTGRLIGRTARLADSTITARTGVGVGTILSIPRRIGEGTEARIKDNYEKGRKSALSNLREGGAFGRAVGFLGASDEVAKKSGIIGFAAGTAGKSLAAGYRVMTGQASGIRQRDTYLSKAAEAQTEADAAKANRESAMREKTAADDALKATQANYSRFDAADGRPGDIAALENIRSQATSDAQISALDNVINKGKKGQNITTDDLEDIQAAGIGSTTVSRMLNSIDGKFKGAGTSRDQMKAEIATAAGAAALAQANVGAFSVQESAALANVAKWTKGAERAGVAGFGPEMPKHAMDATVTSAMLDEALKAKDYTLAQQLVVKLGEDGELADALKLRKHGEGLEGVKAFAKELQGKGMSHSSTMTALSEVDSKMKAKGNTEYSGIIKGGPGGRLRFVGNDGDNREYEAGRLKSGSKGSMESKLREANKTSLFQVTGADGKKVIDAAGAALIAQSIGSIVKTVTENRMSSDMMRMFVDKQKEVLQAVQDAGVQASSDQFKQLETAIGKMTEQIKSVPPDVGDAIRKVYAAKKARGA